MQSANRHNFYSYLAVSIASTVVSEDERMLLMQPMVVAVVLFQRNVTSMRQLRGLVSELRSIQKDLLIFIDNEGVDLHTPIRCGIWRFLDEDGSALDAMEVAPSQHSVADVYRQNPREGLSMAHDSGRIIAEQLAELGVIGLSTVLDSNLEKRAPWSRDASKVHIPSVDAEMPETNATVTDEVAEEVADLPSVSLSTWVIAGLGRSFGAQNEVIALAQEKIKGMRSVDNSYPIAGKHFPDHGCTSGDSHEGLPLDNRPLKDVLAYAEAVYGSCALDFIMPGHVVYTDNGDNPEAVMATFNPFWLNKARTVAGKDVVIISDCLSMGAVDQDAMVNNIALASNPLGEQQVINNEPRPQVDIVMLCNYPAQDVLRIIRRLEHMPTEACAHRLEKHRLWSQSKTHERVFSN